MLTCASHNFLENISLRYKFNRLKMQVANTSINYKTLIKAKYSHKTAV